MTTFSGTFGAPPNAPAWVALLLGLLSLGLALKVRSRRIDLGHPLWLLGLVLTAFLLSLGYVAWILKGSPRIIDATSYLLQARVFAAGDFSFEVPSPRASFSGRFLLSTPHPHQLAVIFPPGYPALLAVAVWLGAPMLLGPCLAALLVALTYWLARLLFPEQRQIALLAALFSTLSATLRYHTADTMSHGAAACLLLGGAGLLLHQRQAPGDRAGARLRTIGLLGAGLCFGLLFATRPVTGLVGLCLTAVLLSGTPRRAPLLALGALPGLALYFAYQKATTGSLFGSAQLDYYRLSDHPAGCFGYGLSATRGCRFEHGQFVAAYLPHGFGWREALTTTGRRLAMHLRDAGNLELFAVLLPVAAYLGRRRAAVRVLAAMIVALIIAYAPFYFDGNYPGAGARMFAEALPFEHLLLGWLLGRPEAIHWGRWVPAALLVGFALHTSFDHHPQAERRARQLAMPDPNLTSGVAASSVRQLMFVTTDHDFNLAFDPTGTRGYLVARRYGDGHDHQLWTRLGKPPAFEFDAATKPELVALVPRSSERLEAEAHWPLLGIVGGSVLPQAAGGCLSNGGLALISEGERVAASFELDAVPAGTRGLVVGWMASAGEVGLEVAGRTRLTTVERARCLETRVELPRGGNHHSIRAIFQPPSRSAPQRPSLAVLDYFEPFR